MRVFKQDEVTVLRFDFRGLLRPSSLISRVALALGLLLGAGHVTAVDFTPHGTQPGLLFSLEPSDSCGGCHGGFSGNDPKFRPHSTWSGSMMANATRDPLFWAAVDVANKDVPGAGDFCLRCHTSQGWYGGRVVKSGFGGLNNPVKGANGCLLQGTPDAVDFSNDFSGVACHFCHRLMPTGPMGEANMIGNANVWLDDVECNGNEGAPCRRGPYNYTSGQP
ncbi:MAG: hypothetical protein ABI866_01665, partial [Dokdonella sp.]